MKRLRRLLLGLLVFTACSSAKPPAPHVYVTKQCQAYGPVEKVPSPAKGGSDCRQVSTGRFVPKECCP